MKRGVFICIEGIDASGKTTQAKLLVKNLTERGYEAIYTSEPTRGFFGKILRQKILYGNKRVPAVIEALLFALDRLDHVEKEIKPALREGKIVVSDRYLYSSIAYQGAAGLDLDWIEKINRWAVKPDLAIYLDVPAETVIKRLKGERSIMENLENQRKVREVYLKLVREKKLLLINGNRSINEVEHEILQIVLEHLKTSFAETA
ncbi:dTMP kinase [Candidatus Bathyarchaeota archaeon]|nr:MAG: dTMP kinase [Candidatus Bathyarchaeota archaeon]